jgi:cell division protein ZapA (FtsZ GTPase activity inhibitor)
MRLAGELGLHRVQAVSLAIQARRRLWHDPQRALRDSAQAYELLQKNGAELFDRVVITGTRAVVLDATGETKAAHELVKQLRRRLRTESQRIESSLLKRRQRLATTRLLEAVLSPEGPVYRRVKLDLP